MTLDDLLRDVVARAGSDLHLQDGLPPKVRVHGDLVEVPNDLAATESGVRDHVGGLVLPVLEARHRAMLDRDGEADLAYSVEGVGRFRVNVFRHLGGLGAVFRLIPHRIPTLAELSIPAEVERFTHMRRGLVLVTGPTGSGKSSTLAALLGMINARDARHIVTIEDPIEYMHQNGLSTFTQREIGRDASDFAEALRSAGRQDPDLVLLGEMRDRETIGMALTLAEMGMLVFSTLHTNGAARTLDRIVEVFSEEEQPQVREMLAETLEGVLSQILCRRATQDGRVPATELMFVNIAIRSMIRDGESHKIDSALQSGRSQGMHRLDDSLFRLAMDGAIAGDEAFSKANEKERFTRFLTQPE
ncbi:MAG: PilT/PilU family type 4a pilus ATPase [Planctomycetes bacterium]|nr:PilT/PilU family type 4a pilus ATPase [Planctomycetota bacterium]